VTGLRGEEMKKFLRSIALAAAMTMIPLLIAGCGGKEKPDPVDDGYIYVPTIHNIELGVGETADLIKLENGRIYYSLTTHDKDYNITSLKIHSEDIDGSNVSEIELKDPFEKEEYLQNIYYYEDSTKIMTVKYDKEEVASYSFKTFDRSGNCISNEPITDLNDEKPSYLTPGGVDAQGNYIFTDDYNIYKLSPDGKLLDKITHDSFLMDAFTDNSGNVYVRTFDNTGSFLKKVDFEKKKITDSLKNVPDDVGKIFDVGDGKYLMFTSDWLCEYSLEAGDYEKIVKYMDIDMPSPMPDAAWINDDGSISFIYTDWSSPDSFPEHVTLRKEVKTADSDKKELVLGVGNADDSLKNAVMSYNRSNGDFRINIREYTDEKTWKFDSDRLKADLSAGALDIVAVRDIEDAYRPEDYTDLTQYLNEDNDIDMADYFENVFKASEYKGKLNSIPTAFAVKGLVVNKDYFSGNSFTYDDYIKLIEQNPDKKVLPYFMPAEFLYNSVIYGGDKFVDYDNAKCNFDCEEFIKLMEASKNQFAETKDLENFDIFSSIRKGETILSDLNVYDYMEVQIYAKILGDKFNPVGFPGKDGSSFAISPVASYAIPANSKNKDGAWQFIRTLLLDKNQGSMNSPAFPVKTKFFEQQIDRLLNGSESMGGSVMTGDTVIELGAPTAEDVGMIRDLVDKAELIVHEDKGIYNIIAEEYDSYSKGGKSAEEVAKIIQSRVSIYLAEQYG